MSGIFRYGRGLAAALAAAVALAVQAAPDSDLVLARQLADGPDPLQAAVEFRRLALSASEPAERAAFYWMAGYAYSQASRYDQSDRMAGLAEEADDRLETEVTLLRSDNARRRNRLREARFYLESLAAPERPEPVRKLAQRRLAAVRVEQGDYEGARQAVAERGERDARADAALEQYGRGRDKRPMVGGLLGLVPGLGYAYSGEYANALRSLLMNGLCIWGLAEFAEREQWGGVAVVGFAEITFYTGSIYGGADAAFRYNERRLRACTRALEGGAAFRPELEALPVLTLRFEF